MPIYTHASGNELLDAFADACVRLNRFGYRTAPRGAAVYELLNHSIKVHNPRQRIINHKARKPPYRYLLGELCFYLSGSNMADFIASYSPFWKSISKEDGTVNSGYGHRIFGKSDRVQFIDQWSMVKDILKADPDSRQAIINIHVPADRVEASRDLPCTLTLQFFIRNLKAGPGEPVAPALHMIVNMRSNDLVKGFTIDFFQFSMLQEILMLELKREAFPDLQLGAYFHNAGSFHVYEPDFALIDEVVKEHENDTPPSIVMPAMDFADLDAIPALLQLEVNFRAAGLQPDYDFKSDAAYVQLTPYWQTMVDICFAKKHELLTDWHQTTATD